MKNYHHQQQNLTNFKKPKYKAHIQIDHNVVQLQYSAIHHQHQYTKVRTNHYVIRRNYFQSLIHCH